MAAKNTNEFVRRAESLLGRRVETAQRLGELLEVKAKQQSALADTEDEIVKAVAEATAAGWTAAELVELGVPKTAKRARRTATATAATPAPTVDADPPQHHE